MKQLTLFLILLTSSFCGDFVVAESVCGDWLPFKDEKCFKILDVALQSYADAIKSCQVLENSPTLPIISSEEEQEFLVNYLFKTSKKVNNFWLGAKLSGTAIKWSDDTSLSYSNWDKDGPRNMTNYCVQMQSDVFHLGKWIDEPCERGNAVVCQRMQTWSTARLQKTLLETRKKLGDELNEAKNKIVELEKKNEESNLKIVEANRKIVEDTAKISEVNKKIIEANYRISNLTQNSVPIGFIYVQLSSQPEPRTLWPTVEWTDVTTEYAGLFFRAEGGGSEKFGTVQPENAPRVTEVRLHVHENLNGYDWGNTVLTPNGWSSGFGVFSGSIYGDRHHTHQFHQSGGEVRPRNSAIRLWKRTK